MESSEIRGFFAALPLPRAARGAGVRSSVHASSPKQAWKTISLGLVLIGLAISDHLTLDGTKTLRSFKPLLAVVSAENVVRGEP